MITQRCTPVFIRFVLCVLGVGLCTQVEMSRAQTTAQSALCEPAPNKNLIVLIDGFLAGERIVSSAGIVFGWDADYLYVATANHTVRPPNGREAKNLTIKFCFSPSPVLAELMEDYDPEIDLAVLRIDRWIHQLSMENFQLGLIAEAPRFEPREPLYRIGHPLGKFWYSNHVAHTFDNQQGHQLEFQADNVQPGDSGGGLFDGQGRLVGMITGFRVRLTGIATSIEAIRARLSAWQYPAQVPDSDPGAQFGYLDMRIIPGQSNALIHGEIYHADSLKQTELRVRAGSHRVHVTSAESIYADSVFTAWVPPEDTLRVNITLKKRKALVAFRNFEGPTTFYLGTQFHRTTRDTLIQTVAGYQKLSLLDQRGRMFEEVFFLQPDRVNEIDAASLHSDPRLMLASAQFSSVNTGIRPSKTALSDSALYLVDETGKILALDLYTLRRKWEYAQYEVVSEPIPVNSGIVVIGRYDVTTTSGRSSTTARHHRILIIDVDEAQTIRWIPGVKSKWVYTAHNSDYLLAAFSNRDLMRFDLRTNTHSTFRIDNFKKFLWETLKLSDRFLFVLDKTRRVLLAYDFIAQQPAWTQSFTSNVVSFEVGTEMVWVQTEEGQLVSLSHDEGFSLWSIALSGRSSHNLSLYQRTHHLYGLSEEGDLNIIEKRQDGY